MNGLNYGLLFDGINKEFMMRNLLKRACSISHHSHMVESATYQYILIYLLYSSITTILCSANEGARSCMQSTVVSSVR